MSNKFEQLLDYLVNEEMEKANELFHEIVVEKSREIYSDLISEEVNTDEDEDLDEVRDEDDDDDEQQDEGYMSDEDESMYEIGGDASDDMVSDIEDPVAMGDTDMDDMDDMDSMDGDDDPATKSDIMDIKDDLAELKAEFEALLASEKHEDEHEGEIGDFDDDGDLDVNPDDDQEDDEEEDEEEDEDDFEESHDEDEEADESFMREYREVVGKPYSSGKVAGTKEDAGTNTHSPVSSAKGRPESKANASNLNQSGGKEGKNVGLAGTPKGEYTKGVEGNINGKGAPKLAKVPAGHGAEKKGHGEKSVNDKPILKSSR